MEIPKMIIPSRITPILRAIMFIAKRKSCFSGINLGVTNENPPIKRRKPPSKIIKSPTFFVRMSEVRKKTSLTHTTPTRTFNIDFW